MSDEVLLELRNVSKAFGGLQAVDDVSLHVGRGEVFSIIGPNGAGKTTLFNLISGVMPVTAGSIHYRGESIEALQLHQVAHLGIGRTFQSTQLLVGKSALDNLLVGAYRYRQYSVMDGLLRTPRYREAERDLQARATFMLDYVGLGGSGHLQANELSTAAQSRLAIAMALMPEPDLILLDEPTGGLIESEVEELIGLISQIRSDGATVVLIEHKMRMVMSISDRIAVLNFGKKIAEDVPSVVRSDPAVLEAYLGADHTF